MRRLGLLVLLCCGLFAPPARADDPSLTLRWHLDQFTGVPGGRETPDSSGNGFTGFQPLGGSVVGGFSGMAARGEIRAQGALPSTTEPTLMAWVRSTGVPSNGEPAWIAATSDPGGCELERVGYGLRVAADGSLSFAARTTSLNGDMAFSPSLGPLPLWDGLWHAVAGVYDGSRLRLYVDGQEVGSGTQTGPLNTPGGTFHTGRYPDSTAGCPTQAYTGDYDEVRIYGRGLTPQEVGWLHGSVGGQPPRVLPPRPGPQAVALRHPLDTVTNGTTPDTGPNNLPGTGVTDSLVAGRFGQGLQIASGYRVADAPALKPQEFTVQAWVKSASPGAFRTIVGSGGGTCSNQSWALRTGSSGGLEFYVSVYGGGGAQITAQTPQTSAPWNNQWHAVAATYADGEVDLWVDGIVVGQGAVGSSELGEVDYARFSERRLGVGRYPQDGCTIGTFNGALDEIRLYDRRLADAEIQALHDPAATTPPPDPTPTPTVTPTPTPTATPTVTPTATPTVTPTATPTVTPTATPTVTPTPTPTGEPEPGLVLKWHLDAHEGDPSDVLDSSGNALHGRIDAAEPVAPARFRGGLRPTGLPDPGARTGAGRDADPRLEPATPTIVAWIRRPQASDRNGWIAGYGATASCDWVGYGLSMQADGTTSFAAQTPGGGSRATGGAQLNDGQWHMVAGVYDGTHLRMYADGAPVGAPTPTGPSIRYDQLAEKGLQVGDLRAASCNVRNRFTGDIDEVRVYDRPLSAEEIAYLAAGFHRRPPTLPIPSGPRNTRRPGVFGIPVPGETLACDPGDWDPALVTRQYLWERALLSTKVEGDDAWIPVDGAASQGYVVRAEDLGSRLRCREIATAGNASGEALSFNTKRVAAGPPLPEGVPIIEGRPAISGKPLTCNPGEWSDVSEPSDFAYRWVRDDGKLLGTQRTYTPTPLRDASTGFEDIVDPGGDGNHDITCTVTASNDVGETPTPRTSAPAFVIDDRPLAWERPSVRITPPNEPNPFKQTAECVVGGFYDAYGDHPQSGGPGYDHTYQWYRFDDGAIDGTPIAGAVGRTFPLTADVLGREISCSVTASNPLGEDTAFSNRAFIPLPLGDGEGALFVRHRDNENDPVNMIATHNAYRQQLTFLAKRRVDTFVEQLRNDCAPQSVDAFNEIMDRETIPRQLNLTNVKFLRFVCYVLKEPSQAPRVLYGAGGLYYKQGNQPNCAPEQKCMQVRLPLTPVDTTTVAGLPANEQAELAPVTPARILWDLEGDGFTDISCPGTSPAIRSKLDIGFYNATATIVNSSVNTFTHSQFTTVRHPLFFPNEGSARTPAPERRIIPGEQRKPQPLWCRNTLEPPPDPEVAPCVSSATVGAVQLQGNMCPINVRSIRQSELEALPYELREVIRAAAKVINDNEAALDQVAPGSSSGLRTTLLAERQVRSAAEAYVAAAAQNTAASVASLGQEQLYAARTGLENELAAKMASLDQELKSLPDPKRPTGVRPELATSFALDQIYAVKDSLDVNGIKVDPAGGLHTMIVPSDVKRAFQDGVSSIERRMTINVPNAKAFLGRLPLTAGNEALKTVISDQVNTVDKAFKTGIDYDAQQMKQAFGDLEERLNQGPFKIAGASVRVELNPDGTATLHANAALPGLSVPDPRGGKTAAEIGVQIRADLAGNLRLQGLSIEVGSAFMFGINLKNFFLSYANGRLEARGQITFGFLGNSGIDIKKFAITDQGKLEALVIDYLAGAGQGFLVGPGLFLTRIGGGFEAPDPIALQGNAALSAIAPSAGGGCPTVGITGGLRLKVSPMPIEMAANAETSLVCIPVGKVDFQANSTGWAKLNATMDLDVPAIVNLSGGFGGEIRTDPNIWQIGANGSARFKFIPAAVDLKGVLSSRGIAACGRATVPTPWPFDDLVLAAGAAVQFPGGVPPLNHAALIANFRAFTGCDLGAYAPLGGFRTTRQADGPMTFPLDGRSVALSFEGAGAEPRVTLVSPSGERFDYSKADDGLFMKGAFGAVLPTEDRSVIMLRRPERGMWTAEVAPGSSAIVRVQRAFVLPKPQVRAKATGQGSNRRLRYSVKRIPGQRVAFVEVADGGSKVLGRVKGGGKGTIRYTTAEATGTRRRVEAQITQDDLPRSTIVVARYRAPNPRLAKPRVRVRRAGSAAVVRWKRSPQAAAHSVAIAYDDGQNKLFTPEGRRTSVRVPGVGRRGGVRVGVTAYSQLGRTATGRARLKPTADRPRRPAKPARPRGGGKRKGGGGSDGGKPRRKRGRRN